MTEAGLNTVNLSELNTWQQVMLFLLIMFGSAVFVSSSVLHIRKRAFEKTFAELVEKQHKRFHRPRTLTFSLSRSHTVQANDRDAAVASGAVRGRPIKPVPKDDENKDFANSDESPTIVPAPADLHLETAASHFTRTTTNESNTGRIRFADQVPPVASRSRILRRSPSFFEGRGVGARGLDNHPRNSRPISFNGPLPESAVEDIPEGPGPWSDTLSKYVETVAGYSGRNSQFHHLSERERRKLGGIEYDAICLLSWLVPIYFVLFQLLGALAVGAWITANRPDTTRTNG